MKKLNALLVIVCLTLFQSCSKHEVTPTNQKRYGGTVSFTANGQAYNLSINSIYVYSGVLELSSLFNKNDQSSTFAITIGSGIAATTYDLAANKAYDRLNYWDGGSGYYLTTTGQLVITQIDEKNKTMSGTFSGSLQTSAATAFVTISNGIFTNVPYVVQDEGQGTINVATIDGTSFVGKQNSGSYSATFTQFGFASSKQLLNFSFPKDLVGGITYNAADLVMPDYFIKYFDGLYTYVAKGGTYTITKYTLNTEIKGTFNVQLESYPVGGKFKSITNGTFAVTY